MEVITGNFPFTQSALRIEKEHASEKIRERKNDKYSLEIIWREAILSQKYESEIKW